MKKEFEPSPYFVSRTMSRIYAEALKDGRLQETASHLLLRYAVAVGGALFGLLNAAVAF